MGKALFAAIFALIIAGAATPALADDRPRLIVITDIGTEPDDIESMVRLLTYSNEIEIEGLIAATSRHLHKKVHPELISERVDAYAKVLPNLRVHDPRYPDAALLKSRIRSWWPLPGMEGVGKGKDNPASRLIIDAVDKADKRPVWVSIWGGSAPLAQALWSVKATRSPAAVAKFVSKLRVYSISDQDDSGPWSRATFPQLFWIASVHGPTQYGLAAWTGISSALPGSDLEPVSRKWLRRNVQAKGPLGAMYPLPMFIMEGDTPSFLNLIDNGLSVPDQPNWGGWGGRWEKPSPAYGHWADTSDNVVGVDGKEYRDNKATIWRWRGAFQNDFAARMNWSVSPSFAGANHAPKLVVNGQAGSAPVKLSLCPGQPVTLSTAGSSDPDGNAISYRWWQYREPTGLWSPSIKLSAPDAAATEFSVPVWEQHFVIPSQPTFTFHMILEAKDNGAPALTRYRRLLITVPTDGRAVNGKACPKIKILPEPPGLGFESGAGTVSQSTAAWSTSDNTIGELVDNPAARAALERHLPHIVASAKGSPETRTMTLRGIAQIAGIPAKKLDEIDAELAKVPGE